MDLGESENIYENPRLQRPIVTLKNFAQPCSFSVKFGCCNLGLSCTFLESPGSIEYRYVFGFPITWGSWPDRASTAPCVGDALLEAPFEERASRQTGLLLYFRERERERETHTHTETPRELVLLSSLQLADADT